MKYKWNRNYPVSKFLHKQETMNKNMIKERKISSTILIRNFLLTRNRISYLEPKLFNQLPVYIKNNIQTFMKLYDHHKINNN